MKIVPIKVDHEFNKWIFIPPQTFINKDHIMKIKIQTMNRMYFKLINDEVIPIEDEALIFKILNELNIIFEIEHDGTPHF